MSQNLDDYLRVMPASCGTSLDGLEDAVWQQIEQHRQSRSRTMTQLRPYAGVAILALVVGFLASFSQEFIVSHRESLQDQNLALMLTDIPSTALIE